MNCNVWVLVAVSGYSQHSWISCDLTQIPYGCWCRQSRLVLPREPVHCWQQLLADHLESTIGRTSNNIHIEGVSVLPLQRTLNQAGLEPTRGSQYDSLQMWTANQSWAPKEISNREVSVPDLAEEGRKRRTGTSLPWINVIQPSTTIHRFHKQPHFLSKWKYRGGRADQHDLRTQAEASEPIPFHLSRHWRVACNGEHDEIYCQKRVRRRDRIHDHQQPRLSSVTERRVPLMVRGWG